VEHELGGLPGVATVEGDQRTQIVSITYDPEKITPDELRKQIE
jgi:copper chaperone CopZ